MANPPRTTEEPKQVPQDEDYSIGEKAPGTPFILVALSYLVVLAIGCGILAAIYWAF